MPHINLRGLSLEELEEFAISIGEKKFRGRQLFHWLYTRNAATFGDMSTLSRDLQKKLSHEAVIEAPAVVTSKISPEDGTTKILFSLSDGRRIESVLIPPRTAFEESGPDTSAEPARLTLCVSTQVGCPLACAFCATATMGYVRNLSSGEIVGQVSEAQRLACRPVTNLVYMGMGEPLMNYDEVMKSISILVEGFNIAAKRITVSTAGLVPQIRRMADEGRKVKLAISLHSLDDRNRTELMPITRKYPLPDLLNAMDYYYRKTKRRLTIEYIPFDQWNDREEDAAQLIRLARRIPCKINIIPFHSIGFTRPTGFAARLRPTPASRIEEFAQNLRRHHVTVFVRSSAGEDIEAACGQLAVTTPRQPDRRNPKIQRTV